MDFKEAIKDYPTHLLTPFIRRSVTPAGVRQLTEEEKQWVREELHSRGEHVKAYPTHYLVSIGPDGRCPWAEPDAEGNPEYYTEAIEELKARGYFEKN